MLANFCQVLFAIKNKKEISTVVLKNWIAAYDTRLPETCVSDLPIISDMRFLFDAYQYDMDEMQIKFICRSDKQILKRRKRLTYLLTQSCMQL